MGAARREEALHLVVADAAQDVRERWEADPWVTDGGSRHRVPRALDDSPGYDRVTGLAVDPPLARLTHDAAVTSTEGARESIDNRARRT